MWDGVVRLKPVSVPKAPYRIGHGDLLDIRASGTFAQEPIHDVYAVEKTGKVALGLVYGRVRVDGLSLEKAEEAIEEHLSKILREPEVSVTVGGWNTLEQEGIAAQLNPTLLLLLRYCDIEMEGPRAPNGLGFAI